MERKPSVLTDFTTGELIAIIIARVEERIRGLEAQIHKDGHDGHIPPSRSTPMSHQKPEEKDREEERASLPLIRYGIIIQGLLSIFSAYEYRSYDRISELMEHLIGPGQ